MFNNKNIFIALTYKCNAFCKKCMTRFHENNKIEISEEILQKFYTLLKKNQYKGTISIGTGEPLLYDGIVKFVSNVLNVNDIIRLRLLTNGMLLSVENNPILFNNRCIWGVTFDAFNQATLQGVQKGVDIEKVKSNVRNVAMKYGGSRIYLNFTVYQSNIEEILPFCMFAVENGINQIYLTELKVFNGYEDILKPYVLKKDDYFYNEILNVKKYLDKKGISTKGINFDKTEYKCECFKHNIASPIIDVNGSVSFCSGREDIYVGNITDYNIEKKWSSFMNKVASTQGKWCYKCYDRSLENGIYRLPNTIKLGGKYD